jgi:hypothetical protein
VQSEGAKGVTLLEGLGLRNLFKNVCLKITVNQCDSLKWQFLTITLFLSHPNSTGKSHKNYCA